MLPQSQPIKLLISILSVEVSEGLVTGLKSVITLTTGLKISLPFSHVTATEKASIKVSIDGAADTDLLTPVDGSRSYALDKGDWRGLAVVEADKTYLFKFTFHAPPVVVGAKEAAIRVLAH